MGLGVPALGQRVEEGIGDAENLGGGCALLGLDNEAVGAVQRCCALGCVWTQRLARASALRATAMVVVDEADGGLKDSTGRRSGVEELQ